MSIWIKKFVKNKVRFSKIQLLFQCVRTCNLSPRDKFWIYSQNTLSGELFKKVKVVPPPTGATKLTAERGRCQSGAVCTHTQSWGEVIDQNKRTPAGTPRPCGGFNMPWCFWPLWTTSEMLMYNALKVLPTSVDTTSVKGTGLAADCVKHRSAYLANGTNDFKNTQCDAIICFWRKARQIPCWLNDSD